MQELARTNGGRAGESLRIIGKVNNKIKQQATRSKKQIIITEWALNRPQEHVKIFTNLNKKYRELNLSKEIIILESK